MKYLTRTPTVYELAKMSTAVVVPVQFLDREREIADVVYAAFKEGVSYASIRLALQAAGFDFEVTGYPDGEDEWVIELKRPTQSYANARGLLS
jgi:hypothetical protein